MNQRFRTVFASLSLKDDFYPLLRLSLPLVLTGFVQSSLFFFQNIFLARLGTDYLAAGGLVSWFFATLIVIFLGTLGAINVLVAHKHGAQDERGISQVFRDGLILVLLLAAPTIWLVWNTAPLFLLFGQSPHLVSLATPYLHALAYGLLPRFIMIVFVELLLGLGAARTITVFTVVTIPLYLFFSWVFIFGKLGFPELGIAGAGWGMSLGDMVSMLLLVGYVLFTQCYRPYLRALWVRSSPSYLWEIVKLGLPMGLMYCIEVAFFFTMALAMGRIDVETLAANQFTVQYTGIFMGSIFSIAQALTIRMGHQIGAKERASAERSAYAAFCLVAIYMGVVALLYWGFDNAFISIFFNLSLPANLETVKLAREFLSIAAAFQIVEGIRIALYGALRGLKDTRFSLLASIVSFWCIALPIGYVTSRYINLGGAGYWVGMLIGACVSFTLLNARFKIKMAATLRVLSS